MARIRLLAMKIKSSGARVRCIQKRATEGGVKTNHMPRKGGRAGRICSPMLY